MSNPLKMNFMIVILALMAIGYGSVITSKAAVVIPLDATEEISPVPTSTAVAELTDRLAKLSHCLDYNPNFGPDRVGPDIPDDAYDSGAEKCADAKPPRNDAELFMFQRTYNIFSWQSFLAINWPVNLVCDEEACEAQWKDKLTDPGVPQWTAWKESYEVFKEDGFQPSAWGAPRTLPEPPECCPLSSIPDPTDKKARLLLETRQANSDMPLWDQNGNMVYYEVLLNDQEFDNIIQEGLYNINGQIRYATITMTSSIDLGLGNYDKNVGPIELKLAWKVLDGEDSPSRFYTMDAYAADKNSGQWVAKKVGLVGMHIIHKTFSSQHWVWSTFEHVDNVQVNDREVLEYMKAGRNLRPLFNNPDCEICPVNVVPKAPFNVTVDPNTHEVITRTQVMRVIPIPKAVEELNRQVQELLKTYKKLDFSSPADASSIEALDSGSIPTDLADAFEKNGILLSEDPIVLTEEQGNKWQIEATDQRYAVRLEQGQLNIYEGSVWQYFELINTQFTTDGHVVRASPGQGLPERITNKSGGNPEPVYLVNSVIETYDQEGNQEASDLVQGPLNDAKEIVFGTQSCIGCHAVAGIAGRLVDGKPFYIEGSADFSWLMQTRARSKREN